jgi:hypothetical protein
MTPKIRCGYVPEHFAAPLLQLADTAWVRSSAVMTLRFMLHLGI